MLTTYSSLLRNKFQFDRRYSSIMLLKLGSLAAVPIFALQMMHSYILLRISSVKQLPHILCEQGWMLTGYIMIQKQYGHVICYFMEFRKASFFLSTYFIMGCPPYASITSLLKSPKKTNLNPIVSSTGTLKLGSSQIQH